MSEIRILGGKYRGRKIRVSDSRIRPTTSIMRERLFNWLGELKGKRCLDLFAGSGALGFEAISRGAEEVTFVDLNPAVLRQLRMEAKKLAGNYLFLREEIPRRLVCLSGNSYDLVFLDPPFSYQLLNKTLANLAQVLKKGSLIYTESEGGLKTIFPNAIELKKHVTSTYQACLWQYEGKE